MADQFMTKYGPVNISPQEALRYRVMNDVFQNRPSGPVPDQYRERLQKLELCLNDFIASCERAAKRKYGSK